MTPREQFIAWLNDAHSTELAQIPVLKNHAKDAADYPEIRDRDLQHLEETKHQAERLEEMIESLGGSVSTAKNLLGKAIGTAHSVSTGIFPDELIKNFLADYASEHFEIASYLSLIATAELIGEDQCVPVLEEILDEEIRMAMWLEQHIPMATNESLKVTAGKNRKRDKGYSKRGEEKQSFAKKLTSPSLLLTLLSAGAVGTTLYLRSKNNKNGGTTKTRSLSDITGTDSTRVTETNTVETVVLTLDEPNMPAAADVLTNTATNNS